MKKIILLLLLASGCAPHNHKAQDAIAAYLQKTVKDPGSYVPISFGEPHATSSNADTVLINHVYQEKRGVNSSVIYSNMFKVDSVSGYAQMVRSSQKTD
ncbi:hypothetical protein GO988_21730 [Hymenobacter sp. HMF4947]|uniref:DUF4136 domain-containing protein n=1 Tax=Hymenobacter ginkgonis TaxID=2682976 RepID=A0A7K1TKL8_9BACT|nr:hypothetical protein [Hymenobacter ginkgonis]MVN78959.1 hypothetical protein [Hymenobacter ginkgonis]